MRYLCKKIGGNGWFEVAKDFFDYANESTDFDVKKVDGDIEFLVEKALDDVKVELCEMKGSSIRQAQIKAVREMIEVGYRLPDKSKELKVEISVVGMDFMDGLITSLKDNYESLPDAVKVEVNKLGGGE